MSLKYGIKIKNIEASTLFEYNNGVRMNFKYQNAMFTNSLFSDFLKENGLKIYKDTFTRDIICLEFNFGSRSYKEEISHLRDLAKQYRLEYKIAKSHKNKKEIEEKKNKRQQVVELFRFANKNKDKYIKKSKEEIREDFYKNGVYIQYITRKRNGDVKRIDNYYYKMLYRSTGKAKKGSCMFIRDRLYNKSIKFLQMGLKLPKENAPIVEMSAYIPLVSSTIVGKVKINPKNILILKDIDSFFKTNVISVELDEYKNCIAKEIKDYELKNTIFDGQALIDSSIFPSWGDGYILLRHHFCKMASFCCNIQKFFKDYFGDNYYNAKIVDMFGNEHYAKDIELITTDNAMKWIKFDVSYEYWCDRVYENNCMFGIVKTAHKSKLGNVQKMSYQMINSLDISIMNKVAEKSVQYIDSLKKDDNVFLDYLRKNENFANDYEVLVALCEQNMDFTRSEYFRRRKEFIIRTYVKKFKTGKIIQDADNLVIVGSPYAMLLHSVGESILKDNTFNKENDCIQCYTERFRDGEYLAEFRSPFNSKNNMGYLHNVYNDKFKKYFNFGKQIIAINMINTDFQDRNNGSDQDSDSLYVTNQENIVEYSKYCYNNYFTIVNNIPKEKNSYSNILEDYARIDNNLAKAQLSIGESSNLAQLCLTYTYNFKDKKYSDYVCILSVLAQVAIDNAKRRFDVDINKEIRRIKDDINVKENGYPMFWSFINPNFNKKRINKKLKCPMNCLFKIPIKEYKPNDKTLPMDYFFNKFELDKDRRKCKKVEEFIEKYSLDLYKYQKKYENKKLDNDIENDYILLRSDFEDMIKNINELYISKSYIGLMSWLIDRAFLIIPQTKGKSNKMDSNINNNKSVLLKTLYTINKKNFLKCFNKNT